MWRDPDNETITLRSRLLDELYSQTHLRHDNRMFAALDKLETEIMCHNAETIRFPTCLPT